VLAVLAAVVVLIGGYLGVAATAKLAPFSAKPTASTPCPNGEQHANGGCKPTPRVSTPTPTAATPTAASPSASLPLSGAVTGGYGDTATNPDQTYTCAFDVISDDNVTTVAYLTIAGSNTTDTSGLCSGFEAQQYYDEVQSLDVSGGAYCWMTSQDGGATLRFYTAPDGTDTTTHALCAGIFSALGVSP
jgi:hypothetical protein